ncbi:DUF4105 domain-containing protein [Marinimicrobium agarilyticum]|uniref:Lnb N-terminal periplasmic domain-containing protein n=1 Tax=Marinimicrobium agarilyticum TaxID=306546 RepID=UPI0003F6BFE3|nr:DUF4105 domain-containing protein [Marinimicrobium agarilyticum]
MPYRWLVLTVSWFLVSCSWAGTRPFDASKPPDRQLTALSENVQWRGLLGFAAGSERESAIKSDAFFLSDRGRYDPREELLATLSAFADERKDDLNDHAVCRFPARYLWLAERLSINGASVRPEECTEFREFSLNGKVDSISLVYATGYLGNPASYYGHLLVKLNQRGEGIQSSLDETAINFGAIIPEHENMLVYIGKGILGGYDAGYTHREYFYHTHNYGENELRDLWEYRLSLSAADRKLFVAHLWELLAKEYQYYFFNRNCAYQIARLLSVVTGEEYVNPRRPWVLPQEVVQAASESTYRGGSLISSVNYLPSRQSRLYARYRQLSGDERDAVDRVVSSELEALGDTLGQQSIGSRQRTLDTLMDYYQFRKTKADSEQLAQIEEWHRAVLLERYRLPPGMEALDQGSARAPHLGRAPSYFSLGVREDSVGSPRYHLRLRPAYYDALDAEGESVRFSTLVMGEVTASFGQGGARLEQLTIVEVENLSRNVTGLPGDQNYSWRLEVGAEQRDPRCDDCLGFKAQAAAGYTLPLGSERWMLSGFFGGGYFAKTDTSEGWFVEPSVQLNVRLTERISARAQWRERHFYRGALERVKSAEARFSLTTNTDVRLSYRHFKEGQLGLAFGYYW